MDENVALKADLKEVGDSIKAKQAEILTAVDAQKTELKAEIADLESKRVKMQEQLDAISTEQAKATKTATEIEEPSLNQAVKNLFASEEFKSAKAEKFAKKSVFQIKTATSAITGNTDGAHALTQIKPGVGMAAERALAFIPYTNAGVVGQDKNRISWMEAAYTTNVGYVAEGTGSASADTATATEKSRGMAKISAKLPLTAEMLEDADYIASQFKMKLQTKSMLFADAEVYGGDGSDSPNPTHIYGTKGHATAFNATTAGVALAVEDANIGDLVDACVLQAEKSEQRGLNTLWINPSDFFRLKKAKTATGEYLFVKDVQGNYTINGLNVVRSQAVTINTMLVADSSKIQLWWKRYPELKFSQMNGTDFVDDAYTAVLFLRLQVVVETYDKLALIYVSDIDAEVANITYTGS
jgi:HK97 family phage major capsid protein